MAFSKASAAAFGAVAFQALAGLSSLSSSRAAWGWQLEVPTDGGFSCEEGTTIGCTGAQGCLASNFTCTVTPDDGKTCDATSITVLCTDGDGVDTPFQPNLGTCINVESYAASKNVTVDTLSWSMVPTCGQATTSGAPAVQVFGSVSAVVALIMGA
mmetsp:Transcript_15463/g.29177  ORF Transcript_15463/g.29177 Transcript_15463/m.29177 type:complete len:156 (+) Transcript_15463:49-516(+)